MKRKEFLKLGALSLGGLYISQSSFAHFKTENLATMNLDKSHAPIIIIGSGYGAAVAALRLCEAGKKVIILEMGLNWGKSGIPYSKLTNPDKSAAWLKKRSIAPFLNIFPLKPFTGVLDRIDFENIKVWVGRGVGGGSLVNGGMTVLPKKEYVKEILPDINADEFFDKYIPLAMKELKANIADEYFIQKCDYYKYSRVGEMEAKKADFKTMRIHNTYDFKYMEKEYAGEVPKSALDGEVIYGNNHGKYSVDKTYLAKALATGNLEILDLHHVQEIFLADDGKYFLDINQIDTEGKIIANKKMSCDKLILAAGTMGSMELLLKSHLKNNLPINEYVGKLWGNNGNFMTGRNFVQAFKGGVGSKQSTIPVAAIDNWNDKENPFFAEIAPLPMGMEVATTLYLLINRVPKKGTITFDEKSNKIKLDWNEKNTENMKENAKYFVKKMNKENGGTRSHLLFDNGYGADICYHPLGGAVLGKATDLNGRLKNHENLFVLDGSLIEASIGANPFLAITALVERCMENLINEKAFG